MSSKGKVVAVNVSSEKGTVKHPVAEIVLDNCGIVGDAHAGNWNRQVSILCQDSINAFVKEAAKPIAPGEFAENITVENIDLTGACVLDRFQIGSVELEIAQVGKKCHSRSCAVYREVGKCLMPEQGLFCRVIQGGKIRPGDKVKYTPKVLEILIITLSDRAFSGEYTDRSGPRAEEVVREFLSSCRWRGNIRSVVLPDESQRLKAELQKAVKGTVDVIFTLGSTGLGLRDIAPQSVAAISQITIPGIMENIRMKFGSENPNALLSRSIAVLADKTQIYTLPGSVRAAEEYLGEILKTLEHAVLMIHGIDAH